ncbi:sigma-54-dependent Fis family transcriptional regulator [Pigmentiphaga aceris]|uniref:Sigma-54-dependent Fis family transcriptional regulator n=1 Tax=Pigmentiphaga aceris TaxID=1940612 RepID=A0A5C0B3K1_9BURK|nr:sigma-54-dependent Fis family transcriptional regulator [Pigmentiphaga aceris]QEI07800.1 sigma-54-dependent Fis family transcriptional regulator [Pigmentiphaga aceris]
MAPPTARSFAQTPATRANGQACPTGFASSPASPDVLDSWARCVARQLDPARPPAPRVIEGHELLRRRENLASVRRLALAEIETLFQQIAGSNFLLAFADAEGVILDLFADNRFRSSGSSADIVVGSCWAEAHCGTNGLGTALAMGRPVSITGDEHFFLKYGDISCTAAPIHDGQGRVLGVLDASSYVESRQRHTQALVRMSAMHVENLLLAEQMRGHLVMAIHPRVEFLATLGCGMIAFDAIGHVSAMNARAQGLLSGLSLSLGTPFERIFDEPFARFSARLMHEDEVRLRDVLGSMLAVSRVGGARAAAAVVSPAVNAGFVSAPVTASASISSPVFSPASNLASHPTSNPGSDPTYAPASTTGSASSRTRASQASALSAQTTIPMVADDPAVVATLRMAEAAVRMRVPILIHGETGTGKELLARHAHASSGRNGAFVAVNCGALPAELFEAELFGYVGGAFTGARRDGSSGLIESADGGTLLLDEIVELPLLLQAALLRFLDDRLVRPVGGRTARHVDVQLLAATHADLDAEVAARRFRADLLHRLNVVRLALPPLRAREDFAAVTRNVLAAIDPMASISDEAVAQLSRLPWRGNMRELRAVLTRALLMHATRHLNIDDFASLCPTAAVESPGHSALQQAALQRVVSEFERTGHSVSQTSRNLGVSRTTVYRYLREQGGRIV